MGVIYTLYNLEQKGGTPVHSVESDEPLEFFVSIVCRIKRVIYDFK